MFLLNVEDREFRCRASQKARDIPHARSAWRHEQISMLRPDREQIPIHRSHGPRAHFKAVGLAPPTAGAGWLVGEYGEKNK